MLTAFPTASQRTAIPKGVLVLNGGLLEKSHSTGLGFVKCWSRTSADHAAARVTGHFLASLGGMVQAKLPRQSGQIAQERQLF